MQNEEAQPTPEPTPEVDYTEEEKNNENETVAKEVLAGHWGRGLSRNKRLEEAGYDPVKIHAEISKILNR